MENIDATMLVKIQQERKKALEQVPGATVVTQPSAPRTHPLQGVPQTYPLKGKL